MIDPANWETFIEVGKVAGSVFGTAAGAILAAFMGARRRAKQEKASASGEAAPEDMRKRLIVAMDNLREQIRELCGVMREHMAAVKENTEVSKTHMHEMAVHGTKMDELAESNRNINSAVRDASNEIRGFSRAIQDVGGAIQKIPAEISAVAQFFRIQLDILKK